MTQSTLNKKSEYHIASLVAYCILQEVEKVKAAHNWSCWH